MSEDFKFNITEEYVSLVDLHVTQTKKEGDAYLNMTESEYELFKDFVKSPLNILDLGCGLGRMSIYLHAKLQNPSTCYTLADTSYYSTDIKTGWNPKDSYYNDLSLTEKFARNHGLTNFKTFDIRHSKLTTLENIDLVMSFLSVGFHNKIESYMDDLLKITTKNCVMIFGVRRNRYSEDSFKEQFKETFLFENKFIVAGKRTKEDVLVLRGRV